MTRIALLLFARTPHAEARHKRWAPQAARQNGAVARALMAQARRALAKAPFPVFEVTEREQRGMTFGARFAHAFAQIFAKGYDAVVSVGSDAPGLVHADWQGVALALQEGRPVLGPDLRGGAYLIGLPRRWFAEAGLAGLPWQSGRAWVALLRYLGEAPPPEVLPALRDLNGAWDVRCLLRQSPAGLRAFLCLLRLALGQEKAEAPAASRMPGGLFRGEPFHARPPPMPIPPSIGLIL